VAHLRRIYIVATEDRYSAYVSIGRRWTDASRIAAFATAREAILANAAGEVFVPGYFVGEDSPRPLSSLDMDALIARLEDIGVCGDKAPVRANVYDGELDFWSNGTNLWFEDLTLRQLAAMREIFDRHADPSIVGTRRVYEIEVE
jgi:hypothetical protein